MTKSKLNLTPPPESNFTPENIPLEIVFEDDHVIVINKPAGLVVHPAAGVHTAHWRMRLAFHFQQLSNAGSIRPGIVHRLDKDTSGLLVVAKTESDHENLADQFRAREVFKSYIALVYGVVKQKSGPSNSRSRVIHVTERVWQLSRADAELCHCIKIRRSYDAFTLLDVELKTGRTHQIRVHSRG